MTDPVIAADGFTYERYAIEQWLAQGHRTSPYTAAPLSHLNITPNHAFRVAVQLFQEQVDKK